MWQSSLPALNAVGLTALRCHDISNFEHLQIAGLECKPFACEGCGRRLRRPYGSVASPPVLRVEKNPLASLLTAPLLLTL